MQATHSQSPDDTKRPLFSRTSERGEGSVVRSHCWYCNKPLHSHRHYCGTECREAMYEDNEHARERRLIFGCQC